MESIIKNIKEEVLKLNEAYIKNSEDGYDFWNEHIKYVYEESKELAIKYNADLEIVELGALLHDIALLSKVGTREEHHINGAKISRKLLSKYNYPEDRIERVVSCVYNHRSSKNATNIEEICVADADIPAHFDNIPMLFNSAFKRNNISLSNIRKYMQEIFEKDYNDLSNKTKKEFKEKYEMVKTSTEWLEIKNN